MMPEIKDLTNGINGLELADVLLFSTYILSAGTVLLGFSDLATAGAVATLITGAYALMTKRQLKKINKCTAPADFPCQFKVPCEVYTDGN